MRVIINTEIYFVIVMMISGYCGDVNDWASKDDVVGELNINMDRY